MIGVLSARAGCRRFCAKGDPDGAVHVGGCHPHAYAVLGGLGLYLLLFGVLLPLALLLVRPQLVPVELRRGDALPHAVLAPAIGPVGVQFYAAVLVNLLGIHTVYVFMKCNGNGIIGLRTTWQHCNYF